MGGVVMLRKMQITDVDQVVNIHLSSFQGFFLTILGPSFLKQLYKYMVISTEGHGYIYHNDGGQVVGFICGSVKPDGFYKRLFIHRCIPISIALLMAVIRNPSLIPRIIWRVRTPPQASVVPEGATVFSIGVHSKHQNKGIGSMLVQEFVKTMQQQDIKHVNLTTDRDENNGTNRFYLKLGFDLEHSFVTPEGRWMSEYGIKLNDEEVTDTMQNHQNARASDEGKE
jgi:ribosomal protein S18 acetylase RimI-like enzyme